MAEAAVGSLEYSALFGLGLVLFIITFLVNTLADVVVKGKVGRREVSAWVGKMARR
jgi:ABC-type phosphate transport system permease subunit